MTRPASMAFRRMSGYSAFTPPTSPISDVENSGAISKLIHASTITASASSFTLRPGFLPVGSSGATPPTPPTVSLDPQPLSDIPVTTSYEEVLTPHVEGLIIKKDSAAPILSQKSVVPTPSTPSTHSATGGKSDLWEKAFKRLSPDDTKGIVIQKEDSEANILEKFICEVGKKAEECKKKKWSYKYRGEPVYYFDVLLTHLNKYALIGDLAIQHHPDVVALVWSGFRLILQVATADMKDMQLVSESLEYLTRVLSRCDIYEKIYRIRRRDLSATSGLESSLENLYVAILKYLCAAGQQLSGPTAKRVLKSIFSDLGSLYQDIKNREKEVWDDADSADKEAAIMEISAQEERIRELKEILAQIQAPIGVVESFLKNENRSKILKWLSEIPIEDHHKSILENHHRGTGKWLLENHGGFKEWEESGSSIFWLYGNAGVGKTVLASMIVDRFKSKPGAVGEQALAYFYCNYREESKTTLESILGALVKQLCLALPRGKLPMSVLSIYEIRKDRSHLSLDESKGLIVELSAEFTQTTIIIDALDECDRTTRNNLLSALNEIIDLTKEKKNVGVLVTSRNSGSIRRALNNCASHYINAKDNTEDINSYISSEVESRFKQGRIRKECEGAKNDIISTLSEKANGMFMWAYFQIVAISEEINPGDIRTALEELPKNLNETYTQVLKRIDDQKKGYTRMAKKMLDWLLFASPGTICSPQLVINALAVNPGESTFGKRWEPSEIVDVCQNLVVYDKALGCFRFAHFSVQQFLLHDKDFTRRSAQANTTIAEICLTMLIYHPSEQIEYSADALLNYAISNWAAHVRLSEPTSDTLKKLMEDFLTPSSYHYELWASIVIQKDANLLASYVESISSGWAAWMLYYLLGMQCSSEEIISPLWVVGYYHLHHSFESMVNDNRSLDFRNRDLQNLLFHSARYGEEKIVQRLLEIKGSDVNLRDRYGRTALIWAADKGHENVVRKLLEKDGVDQNSKDSGNRTALSWAAERGHEKAVRVLLGQHADINAKDEDGRTALSWAAERGHVRVVQLLLDSRADLKIDGLEALFLAVERGHEKVVKVLKEKMEKGTANLHSKDNNGQSALDLAIAGKNEEVVKILEEQIGTLNRV